MAGLYLHIPFCKKACHYCNFHFSTSLSQKDPLLKALNRELVLRKGYLSQAQVDTIYFGGGTPSLLSQEELEGLLETIYGHYDVSADAELTLEANPDDLSPTLLRQLSSIGINRLSIGIQSFHDKDLKWMNRSHDAAQAKQALLDAQELGFSELSVDLIFGCPTTTDADWEENLRVATALSIPHLSCYGLTVEEKTALAHQLGGATKVNEKSNAIQYDITMAWLQAEGYVHYEISNFAKEGSLSRHNSNYWKQISYLGIGPSAHSYDGQSRQWNVAHNSQYIKALNQNEIPAEMEQLKEQDRYNEYLMTRMRTIWGVDPTALSKAFPQYADHFVQSIKGPISEGHVEMQADRYILKRAGKMLADQVIAELFIT